MLEETYWQNNLVRVAVGLGVAASLVSVAAVVSASSGSDGETFPYAAIAIILPAVAALLVLSVYILREREALSERLPIITHRRVGWALLAAVCLVPILHVGFVLCLCTLGLLAVVVALPDHGHQVRGVAVCNALLCIALAEVMRRAGAGGDYFMARVLVGVYASVGAFVLPAMCWLAGMVNSSRFGRLTLLGYGLFALHAALLVLYSVGNIVVDNVRGRASSMDQEGCIKSIVMSPTAFALDLIGGFAKEDEYDGPSGYNMTLCPVAEPVEVDDIFVGLPTPKCDVISQEWIVYWLLVGLYLVVVLVVYACWRMPVQVEPEEAQGEDQQARRPGRCSRLCLYPKRCAVLLVLAGLALPLLFAGSAVMPCPSDSQAYVAAIVLPTTTTTTTTTYTTSATTITTTTTTTTSSTTTTSTTSVWPNGTEFNTSTTMTATFTSSTTTSSTRTRTTTTTNETYDCPPLPEASTITAAETILPEGCVCGDEGAHGLMAFVAVPYEQLSKTWCELGPYAALLVTAVAYACHALMLALVSEETAGFLENEAELAHKAHLARMRKPPDTSVRRVDSDRMGAIVLFRPSTPEPVPQPRRGGGDRGPRVFMV